MSKSLRPYMVAAAIVLMCGCLSLVGLFGPGFLRLLARAPSPRPNFDATVQALVGQATATTATGSPEPATTVDPGSPPGKIVFTCQLFKFQSSEQICIMNPDGSGYRRLTKEDGTRHYYPSLAPDGKTVIFSQYRQDNVYEVYSLDIESEISTRLTDRLGVLTGPEVSPDGSLIAFMRWTPASERYEIWVMDRDGGNPRRMVDGTGWDPTWSPDGDEVLFASDRDGSVQLFRAGLDGSNPKRVSNLPAIRGRSDWSAQDMIATYSGEAWAREVYVMRPDGSELRRVSPPGGNSQGPSFSPDGEWIVFTAYFDRFKDDHGCEIYIVRLDGTDLRRLTNNGYCDYQPRWGP